MSHLEKIKLEGASAPRNLESVQADHSVKSLLTDAQNDELRLVLSRESHLRNSSRFFGRNGFLG
jgi:hypothetical protein